jgi:hypothetical protein
VAARAFTAKFHSVAEAGDLHLAQQLSEPPRAPLQEQRKKESLGPLIAMFDMVLSPNKLP